jgi:hypothetical protein
MLYVRRKFKSVSIDLTHYIYILFVLNLIFESLLVSDIVAGNFPSRYLTLIKKNMLILSKRGRKRKQLHVPVSITLYRPQNI